MNNFNKTITLAGIFLLAGIGLFIAWPNQASAQTLSIMGTVTEPDLSTPVDGASIDLHKTDWSYMNWGMTESDGSFNFYDVPSGNYVVEVYGNHGSYLDPDPIEFFYNGSTLQNLGTISLQEAAVTLTLTKSDSSTPVQYYWVDLRSSDYSIWKGSSTNANGQVSFGLESNGSYVLEMWGTYEGESPPDSINFTYSGTPVNLSASFLAPNVFGYIKKPDETACTSSECSISFYDQNWQDYYWASPDESGYFSLNISTSNTYQYRIDYWGSTYSAPEEETVTINANANNNMGTIYLLTPNITGKLVDGEGNGVSNAWYDFHNSDWSMYRSGSTADDGTFGIAVSTNGTYYLDFWIDSYTYPDYAAPPTQEIVYNGSNKNLGNIELGVPAMKIKVTNSSGTPQAWANVDLHDNSWSWQGSYWGSTDETGVAIINKSLASGTYTLTVNPPWDASGLLPADSISVSLISGQTNTTYFDDPLVLQTAQKKITGKVSYPDGRAASDAWIDTWAMGGMYGGYSSTETNSSGRYTLWVGQGSYQVNIWPSWNSGAEPDWGSPGPQTVEFTQGNNVAETKTVNFTVAEYNATLKGKVVKPDGSAIGSNLDVSIDAWEKGGFLGNWGQADANGNFSLKVAGGRTYDVMVWAWSMEGNQEGTEYAGPSIAPTKVGDRETVDLGTLKLVEKSATIAGKVTDTNGATLENINMNAWSISSMGWGWTNTDGNGDYSMAVFPGTYMIDAFPSYWESSSSGASYVPINPPQQISVQANKTVNNIDFTLGIANNTLKGHLETPDGELISGMWGWVNASNSRDEFSQGDMWMGGGMLGGPLNGGQFEFKVPDGKYKLKVFNDWNAQYTQSADVTVNVADGQTKDDIVITMLPNDAKITGRFKDSEGNTVYNVWGEIFGDRSEGGSAFTAVNPDGTYTLNVAAGTWNLNYWVDPFMGAAYLPSRLEDKKVTVESEETVTLDFTLLEIDSEISGVVKDQNGNALEGAYVYASLDYAGQKRDTAYSHYGFNSMEDISAADGSFSIEVPEGEYYLHASLPPELGYIFTGAQVVYTSPNEPAADEGIIFKAADSQITGTVTLDGSGNEAFIYAYTDTGGYSETSTSNGSYTIPVTSGDTWNVGAVDEDGNSYYLSDQKEVEVTDESGEQKNLTLEYQGEMPDPVTTTFDSTTSKTLELSDGMEVELPARSLATEGNVTVSVEPTAELAYQADTQPLSGYGYNLEARDGQGSLITNFNSDVTLTIPYDETKAEEVNLEEDDLDSKYYDTTSGSWDNPTTVIPDEDNNKFSVQVDHFSTFSAVTPGISAQSGAVGTLTLTVTAPTDGSVVTTDSVVTSGAISDADATVTIRLNGVSIGEVTVDSTGAFSESVSGLLEGENTIRVSAVKGITNATPVTKTVIYAQEGETPIDTATGISYDIAVITNENSSPHVRIFNSEGELQNSFFAFSEAYRGEFRIIAADVNGDDSMEIIAWPYGEGYGPQVRIFQQDGTLLAQELVLNEGYRSGIQIVNNIDLDGDGKQDMVIVPRGNGGPNLRAYKYNTQTGAIDLLAWTMAYQEEYQGEINVVTADVTGDGNINIITSPKEGGPNVRVFHYDSTTESLELDDWFMAYQVEFRGGVLVATGDVNGDGQKDIVTYPENDGGANIRAYTYNSTTEEFELISWVQPFSSDYRGTMTVKVADLDKDRQAEIITAPATNGGPNLRVYSYNSASGEFDLKDWEMVFAEDFRGGVGITISNLDGDGYREVVVYPLQIGGPNLRVYEYGADDKLTLLDWTYAYAEDFRGEMSVKVSDLDGDGVSSLIVTPLNGGGPNLRIIDVSSGALTVSQWFMAYAETFRGGVLTKFIN